LSKGWEGVTQDQKAENSFIAFDIPALPSIIVVSSPYFSHQTSFVDKRVWTGGGGHWTADPLSEPAHISGFLDLVEVVYSRTEEEHDPFEYAW
jgi:hypothetical protein